MQERIIAPQRFKSSLLVWENLTQRRKVVLFSINMASHACEGYKTFINMASHAREGYKTFINMTSHAREGYKVYINSAFQRCEGCKAIVM